MKAQLLLSAHLSPSVWGLMAWLQYHCSVIALVHPVTFIIGHSLRAWSCPDCCPVSVLSSLSSYHLLPLIHLFSSFSILSSHSFTSQTFIVFYIIRFSPAFLSHHHFISELFFSLLFPSLFSVKQWNWKVHPSNLKDATAWELSVNAAWSTGLVHVLPHERLLMHDEHCRQNKAGLVHIHSNF